jgi:hypothetical protein
MLVSVPLLLVRRFPLRAPTERFCSVYPEPGTYIARMNKTRIFFSFLFFSFLFFSFLFFPLLSSPLLSSSFLFFFSRKTGFLCAALAALGLSVDQAGLCFPSTGIKGVGHYHLAKI